MKSDAEKEQRGVKNTLRRHEKQNGKKGEDADMNFAVNFYNTEVFVIHRTAPKSSFC